jgi:hypothetical protein
MWPCLWFTNRVCNAVLTYSALTAIQKNNYGRTHHDYRNVRTLFEDLFFEDPGFNKRPEASSSKSSNVFWLVYLRPRYGSAHRPIQQRLLDRDPNRLIFRLKKSDRLVTGRLQ